MSQVPSYTPKDIIKLLEKRGFVCKRIKGSHYFFMHPDTKKITSVPMHNKDLPKGTFYAILKQAGIEKSEL